MRFYWRDQGLSKNKSKWPDGRGWLRIVGADSGWPARKIVGLEWHFWDKSCGITLDLNYTDGCRGVMLYIGIPLLLSLYITLNGFIPSGSGGWLPGHWGWSRLHPDKQFWYPEQRSIGVRIFDKAIWFSLWENVMESSSKDPWWWRFNIHPLDILFGREKYTNRDIESGITKVLMPEGAYPATYRVFESTWKRPRLLFRKKVVRTEIELEQPIPFSGKGENSYDCGEDGIWCITLAQHDWQRAAWDIAFDAMRTRLQRGDPLLWPVAPSVKTLE